VSKKYGKPRCSMILYDVVDEAGDEEESIPDYAVNLFLTKEGYFKKITPQSLRMSGEQKLKEGDEIAQTVETQNNVELLFFTSNCQVYKTRAADFSDTKASVLGDYVAAKLGMEENERVVYMAVIKEYKGFMLFAFENGKLAKVEMPSYETKTNRKKLIGAYCDKFPLAAALYIEDESDVVIHSSSGRRLLLFTGEVTAKTARATQGVQVMTQKKGHRVTALELYTDGMLKNPHRYRGKSLPAGGALPAASEAGEQVSMLDN